MQRIDVKKQKLIQQFYWHFSLLFNLKSLQTTKIFLFLFTILLIFLIFEIGGKSNKNLKKLFFL